MKVATTLKNITPLRASGLLYTAPKLRGEYISEYTCTHENTKVAQNSSRWKVCS